MSSSSSPSSEIEEIDQSAGGNIDREMSRRQMIKTVGVGAGATAIGTGLGSNALPDQMSPVGNAQAFACGGLCVGGLLTAGAVAGIAIAEWQHSDPDLDESQIEDHLHEAGVSLSEGRADWETEIKAQYDPNNPQKSPHARTAWAEIETATAKARANGLSRAEAKTEAQNALQEQTLRSIANIAKKWNSAMKGLTEQFIYDLEDSNVTVYHAVADGYDGTLIPSYDNAYSPNTSFEPWAVSESNNNVGIKLSPTDQYPGDASQLDGRDEDIFWYVPIFGDDSSSVHVIANPVLNSDATDGVFGHSASNHHYGARLEARHPDRETETIIDASVYHTALKTIELAYDQIANESSTYVDTLYDSFEEGTLAPGEIISPAELYDQFATDSRQKRVTAQLVAVGAQYPSEEIATQAKVSHPDLVSESEWGTLYPYFNDQSDTKIEAGTTIKSSEYQMAYLAFPAADTNETTVRLLSGDSDLQILKTENRESDVTSEPDERSAGTNGKVTVWDTTSTENGGQGEAPEPLKFPESHPDWYVEVIGAENLSNHDMTEVTKTEGENGETLYVLDSTSLNEGELVEAVNIRKSFNYTQSSRYVSDPTTIDNEQVQRRVESYRELADAIDQLDNSVLGGGGLFDGGFPTLPGLGVIESAVVVILGIVGLNAASS